MRLIVFLILTMFHFSCNRNSREKNGVDTSLSQTQVIKIPEPYELDYSDSTCQKQIEKAKIDVEKGVIVYTIYQGIDRRYVYENEIRELLQKKNIKYKPLGENCTGELNCYGHYMDSLIKVKNGSLFIDSILINAKELSESKWKTKIYNYFEVDNKAYYLDSNDERYPEKFLKSKIHLPKDWKQTPRHSSIRQYALLSIIINNKGTAIFQPDQIKVSIKDQNRKYTRKIVDDIKTGIASMDIWTPAKLNGHNVGSTIYIDISLDNP